MTKLPYLRKKVLEEHNRQALEWTEPFTLCSDGTVDKDLEIAHLLSSAAGPCSLLHGRAGSGGRSDAWVPRACPPTTGCR